MKVHWWMQRVGLRHSNILMQQLSSKIQHMTTPVTLLRTEMGNSELYSGRTRQL